MWLLSFMTVKNRNRDIGGGFEKKQSEKFFNNAKQNPKFTDIYIK